MIFFFFLAYHSAVIHVTVGQRSCVWFFQSEAESYDHCTTSTHMYSNQQLLFNFQIHVITGQKAISYWSLHQTSLNNGTDWSERFRESVHTDALITTENRLLTDFQYRTVNT